MHHRRLRPPFVWRSVKFVFRWCLKSGGSWPDYPVWCKYSNEPYDVVIDGIISFSLEYLDESLSVVSTAFAAIDGVCAERYEPITLI